MSALTIIPNNDVTKQGSVGAYILTNEKFCHYLFKFSVIEQCIKKESKDASTQTEYCMRDRKVQTYRTLSREVHVQTQQQTSDLETQTEKTPSSEAQAQCSLLKSNEDDKLLSSMYTRMEDLCKINCRIEKMVEQNRRTCERFEGFPINLPLKRGSEFGDGNDNVKCPKLEEVMPKKEGNPENVKMNNKTESCSNWPDLNELEKPSSVQQSREMTDSILRISNEMLLSSMAVNDNLVASRNPCRPSSMPPIQRNINNAQMNYVRPPVAPPGHNYYSRLNQMHHFNHRPPNQHCSAYNHHPYHNTKLW